MNDNIRSDDRNKYYDGGISRCLLCPQWKIYAIKHCCLDNHKTVPRCTLQYPLKIYFIFHQSRVIAQAIATVHGISNRKRLLSFHPLGGPIKDNGNFMALNLNSCCARRNESEKLTPNTKHSRIYTRARTHTYISSVYI